MIDFINRTLLRGLNNPIQITSGHDLISDLELSADNSILYAASFEQSKIIPIHLDTVPPTIADEHLVVGFPAGVSNENPSGANTGVGKIARRRGDKDQDYKNEDLFVLTGFPGQVIGINTGLPAIEPPNNNENVEFDDSNRDDENENLPGETCISYIQEIESFVPGVGAGFGSNHLPQIIQGAPRGLGKNQGSLDVLSLGFEGEIIFGFDNCKIVDGDGVDFVIFENAFNIFGNEENPFAELGIVGVSSDGVNFVEFDCDDNEYPYFDCAGWTPVLSHPDNDIDPFDLDQAGGDQFDLADIGVESARYIRIRDIGNAGGGNTQGFDLDSAEIINGEKF